jgi:prepilin-type N-terminal cleavage/methylation domain-containing protein
MRSRTTSYRAFTLIEMLVVIVIILLVSAVALPTVLSALSHRQVGESARLLQAALAGARDAAIRNNSPSGIRLLPDPLFNGVNPATGQLDSGSILAANRLIPIEPAPAYHEGLVTIDYEFGVFPLKIPYPGAGGGIYPLAGSGPNVLLLQESGYNPNEYPALPNAPTSWFWNIRAGDRLQINNAGPWYTVVGPMNVTGAAGNPELFVNVGAPGTQSPLRAVYANGDQIVLYYPEFLLLVNGVDDNNNGWTDEGWDGIDNNGDGSVDELAEWESEVWTGASASLLQNITNMPYVVRRRPAPSPNAREIAFPSQVVVDLTTWNSTRERSRLPVNRYAGYVDILVNPDGSVVPTTIYSTPALFGLSSAFFHFWLAERSDLATPRTSSTTAPLLPLPAGLASTLFNGLELKGEYRLVTLFSRTGHITTNDNATFDNPASPAMGSAYNPNLPFLAAQQGVSGRP